jgi:hypothetical protein
MTSPDGITWTIRSSAADNSWYGVTYGNGTFVAVAGLGTGNRVMTSPDGITWTIRSSAADNNGWFSVTYGNGTFVAVAYSGTGKRVMTSPPWTNTPLSSSVPPLVAAGPGVAGTGTSAQRSDSQQGLSATNPNKGDFFRSPTGTDTATNTGTTWDHALDLVRYAGSGTADPTAGAGVPCLLASGSPLSMCLYYQTVHCNDGGCTYAIWWKSGSGDTQWTQFGTGGGGGGGTIALTSPLGTINIGSGGGLTTEDVVFGHAVHTALQGSEWNAASGVCPLDPNTMVPLANLYASTESHAGTMSAADKIILDNMVSDTYEVKAAVGSTPGFLAAVTESTDSSITIGQTGDYMTLAANFGTGASQVCSGATCAGLQSQLPACAPGKFAQFGTVTQTGTDTNTTTSRSCQSLPSYVSPPPVSTVHNIATSTSSSTLTALATAVLGDNAAVVIPVASTTAPGIAQRATDGRIAAASGTASSTAMSVLAADVKVARSTNRNISTTTATATASSTATDVLGSDAQVVLPVANASTQGISKVASNAAIASSNNTGTAASTAGATCMPADATANGDHKFLVDSPSTTPKYLNNAVLCYSPLRCGRYADTDQEFWDINDATASARGVIQLDPNAPPAIDGGPAAAGSSVLVSRSDSKPKIGSNSPTPGDVLMGVSDTTTATATNTSTSTVSNLKFGKLPESSVAGLTTDLSTRPTYSSFTTGCLPKAGSASSLTCSSSSDDGHGIVNGGTSGLSTLRHLLNLGAEGYGEPGAYGVDSNGDKVILYSGASSYDGRMGVGNVSDFWFKSSGPTTDAGIFRFFCGSTPTLCASISTTGITAPNIGGLRFLKETIFTSSNAYFSLQTGTTALKIYGRGGGGQGGGAQISSASYCAVGGGGAQGGAVEAWIPSSVGAVIVVTIGSGGSGSNCSGGGTGGSGTDTSILVNGVLYTGNGGPGGLGMYTDNAIRGNTAPGGAGVGGVQGNIMLSGANGGPGILFELSVASHWCMSGAGGGEGGGGARYNYGVTNGNFGGGGGGGMAYSANDMCQNGGTGGNGWAKVEEYSAN